VPKKARKKQNAKNKLKQEKSQSKNKNARRLPKMPIPLNLA
jgi:hypothetical protein